MVIYPEDCKVFYEPEAYQDPEFGFTLSNLAAAGRCDTQTAYKIVQSSSQKGRNGNRKWISVLLKIGKKNYYPVKTKYLRPTTFGRNKKETLSCWAHRLSCGCGESPLIKNGMQLSCKGKDHFCQYTIDGEEFTQLKSLNFRILDEYQFSYDQENGFTEQYIGIRGKITSISFSKMLAIPDHIMRVYTKMLANKTFL